MPSAVSFLLAFLADPSCEWMVVPLAEFHARLTAVCLSAIFMAFVVCVVCAVSSRRKFKHTAALLALAIGMTIAAQKDLTNGTDGVSAPLPPMMSMGPRFGDPPDSSTNETETAALAFTSFSVSTNGVGFATGWLPGLGLACLDLLHSERLGTNGWNVLDRWPVAPAQTNDTRFVAYGGSFTNAASGFFNLRGYTYAGDPDADGLSIAQELSLGTDPFAADTDGDGSSDGEELGTVTVLTGEDFLWLDMPTAFNRVPTDCDSYWWLDNLDRGFRVGGERLGRIESSIDGFTHFYVSEIWNVWSYGWYDDAMAFRTNSLSGGFLTVAAANADLYARHDAWGSAFRYASVATNGVTYYVLQYSNLGLKENRTGDSPLLSYEVIFSEDVPDVVYVSYGRVDEGIRSLDMKLGVQVAAWRNPLASDEYYTLMCPVAGSNLCAGTTIRYELGAATDPLVSDTDGDGVPDGSDPLPHDRALGSHGQDETWVRMNFTNAEEILSVGYADWVDAQVGVGLTNGLYKFTATFPSAPAEPTRLTVGGVPVLVSAAGDYVFLLEKGAEYSFNADPYDADVTYAQTDDLVAAPVVPDTTPVPRQWTVGGGEVSLVEPTATAPGSTLMMPVLLVTPDVTDAGWQNFPMTFSAFLSDCRGAGGSSFLWTPGNDSVVIASPNSSSTSVYGQMAYDETFLSVSTSVNGRTLTACLPGDHRDEPEAEVTLRASCPRVVFLNDDHRAERVYVLTVTASCPVPTNGVISVAHSGATGVTFFIDGAMTSARDLLSESLVYSGGGDSVYTAHFACSGTASGTFTVTMSLPNGDTRTATADYTVIEPIRKLVTNELDPQTRAIVNPCCLVFGREASLMVGVNGSFSPDDVVWSVVSGPGRLVSASGFSVRVEPTQSSGTVVVEARFNDDAVQPTFVLPIVTPQTVPIRAFVVHSDKGVPAISDEDIAEQLRYANRAFAQVGISFDLVSIEHHVADSSYWNVTMYESMVDPWGVEQKTYTEQALRLLGGYHERDCIEVYYVGSVSGESGLSAVCTQFGIIMGQMAQPPTLAHELGHAFGLRDIYDGCVTSEGIPNVSPDMCPVTEAGDFAEVSLDWGSVTGRGFYELGDTRSRIVRNLLMYGLLSSSADIPSGNVAGVPDGDSPGAGVTMIRIGRSAMVTNVTEAYSK